jgi:hypothetical protein
MSFLDDLGNWLHKTVDDSSNAIFGGGQTSPGPSPGPSQGPPLRVSMAQPGQIQAPNVTLPRIQPAQPVQPPQPVVQQTQQHPIQITANPQLLKMPNQPLQVVGPHQPAVQQPDNPLQDLANNVIHFGQGVVGDVAQDATKTFNTAALPIAAGAAAVTGQANNPQTQQNLNQMLNNSFVPRDVAGGQATPGQFAGDFTKTALHLAPYAVGGADGKLIDEFGNVIGNRVGDGVAGTVANKAAQYGAQASVAAPTFAALNAAQQLSETGHFDPIQALQAGGQAAAMTLGGSAVGDLAHGAVSGVKNTNFGDERGSIQLPGKPSDVPDAYKPLIPIAKAAKSADDFDQQLALLNVKRDTSPAVKNAINLVPSSNYAQELYGRLNGQQYEYGEPIGDIASRVVQQKQIDTAKVDQIPYDLQPLAGMAKNYPSPEQFEKSYNAMITNAQERGDMAGVEQLQNQKTLAGDLQGFYKKVQDVSDVKRIKLEAQQAKVPKPEQLAFPDEVMEYANTFGITPHQAMTDLREMKNPSTRNIQVPDHPEELTPEDRRKIIASEPERQGTTNKVDLDVEKGNIKGAIAKAMSSVEQRNERLGLAAKLVNKLSNNDKELFYQWDDGSDPEQLAQHADNPTAFKKAIATDADAFDYHLATDRAAGGTTLKQRNYALPKIYKLSPEQMDAEGIPETQRFKQGKYTGFRDTSSKYRSYIDAYQQKGLEPFYDNPAAAIEDYLHSGSTGLRNQLLYTTLAKAAPEHVADLATVADSQGRHFTQAAGHLPFAASDELQPYLKNFKEPYKADNRAIQLGIKQAAKANSAAKALLFFGSPFHYHNMLSRFLGLTVGSGHGITAGKGTIDSLAGSLIPTVYRRNEAKAIKDGYRQYAIEQGAMYHDVNSPMKIGQNSLKLKAQNAVSRVNPFGLQQRNMGMFSNTLMDTLAHAAMKAGVKSGSTEATSLFHEYNQTMGLINAAVEGHDPTIDRIISGEALAPQWTRSQLGLVKDAVVKSTIPGKIDGKNGLGMFNAGDVARTTVIGTRLTQAAFAIIASAVATGAMPTLESIINRGGFNPNNPQPNVDLGQKKKNGEHQVTDLPTDPLGMALGAVSDPIHFLNSRTSPAISFATRELSNQDWNGAQLADPNKPNFQLLKLLGAAKGDLPIGLQNFTNPNLTINQGVQQEFGGRVKTDPNDPQAQQTNQYFQATDAAKAGLTQNDLAVYNAIHPTTKDANGNYIVQPSVWDTSAKAELYMRNPNVFAADQKVNQTLAAEGQSVDPFWTKLNSQQQQALLSYQTMPPGGSDKAKWVQQNGSWYTPFNQERSAWFNTLPPADPNKPQQEIQPPQQSAQLSNLLNQYDNLTDSQARAQFISANPQIGTYFNQMADYNNQMRTAKGYDPLRTSPQPDANTENFMNQYFAASTGDRKGLRNAYPEAYLAMQNYMANNDRYQLDKQAGLDQLIGPGQNNLTAPAQAYDKSAFNLGQYDIAKGTDANGNPAYQWFPSTNTAAGSTANTSPITSITAGGYGFKGIDGYSGSSSGGGSSKKKPKKARIFIKRQKVRYVKIRKNKHIGVGVPKANTSYVNLDDHKKITLSSKLKEVV